jgi:hypothetical protein
MGGIGDRTPDDGGDVTNTKFILQRENVKASSKEEPASTKGLRQKLYLV